MRRTLLAAALAAGASLPVAAASAAGAAPAAPAACDGVLVVVDFNELGGEDLTSCVEPGSAADAFDAAGVAMEFLPQQPGFVCRVAGEPATGPCFDGDAYWSLWWSAGTTGWAYATLGVTSLEVPSGGAVGWAWHQGDGSATPPDVAPPAGAGAGTSDAAGPTPSVDPQPRGEVLVNEELNASSGVPWWAVAGATAVLAGAATQVVRRRRR
ncbi:hypothetical protein E8D34_06665 [Nocardioides sp. GY 10113]|uniref:hypothetical protein n=1 Tax=Nocardioides sp. GY 10113 TaxID=2569761 RepID=UPI0010A835A2|nr:hypothetical protein [Nocardioides sp. GY 10113]TIC87970.1 hypothetical protein E8D34_06665 [Nocardioides sp. GY 10113]